MIWDHRNVLFYCDEHTILNPKMSGRNLPVRKQLETIFATHITRDEQCGNYTDNEKKCKPKYLSMIETVYNKMKCYSLSIFCIKKASLALRVRPCFY